jgi:hypothetical protein
MVSSFFITSCMDSGEIKIQNKVHNTKLENISFGDISVYSSLLPGESSPPVKVTDEKDLFPKINQLEFYMVSNGNRVYLKTKSNYQLNSGETLLITISDSTEVINPLME